MASSRMLDMATKALGIQTNDRYTKLSKDLEDRARQDLQPEGVYVEEEPTLREVFRELKPTKEGVVNYARELFPCTQWIPRYNLRWLTGDLIAGITVGFVVVPQAMAYALLAQLSPEFGLYTSFSGAVLYWLFGTSRDIVIGTTAVGSLLVGSIVTSVEDQKPGVYAPEDVAKTVSLVSGVILLIIGLLRLGWVIEFIPYIPISAFVTSASITIMLTQLPVCLGIPGLNTRESPYRVLGNTLKALPNARLDAAIGVSCLVLLLVVREFCAHMARRQPHKRRLWEAASSLRQVAAMLIFTVISFIVNRNHRDHPKFRLVNKIETILPELPAILIILIIEHIAIAKSFGRMYNYTVVASQEIVAQGAANLLGPFVGGYSCTGSFGASAVLSKAGVRTPASGLFSAGLLILALYVLTGVFFYIPMAALAALIIHAVSNLVASPATLYGYWQLSQIETCIWVIGVVCAFFESLEVSMYVTISLSIVVLLIGLSRSTGKFVGRVKVYDITRTSASDESKHDPDATPTPSIMEEEDGDGGRFIFVPLDKSGGVNPEVEVRVPYPGVIIYRFPEGFNYTNHAHHIDVLRTYIEKTTRRTTDEKLEHPSVRPLMVRRPRTSHRIHHHQPPPLRAVVLDFSAVNRLDITTIHGLVHLRDALDRYAAPDAVEWHFANMYNRWTRRALAISGFGYPVDADGDNSMEGYKPRYTVGEMAGCSELGREEGACVTYLRPHCPSAAMTQPRLHAGDGDDVAELEAQRVRAAAPDGVCASKVAAVYAVDRPLFHGDLVGAVGAAVRNAKVKDGRPLGRPKKSDNSIRSGDGSA
ncbi:unnamed protein product [Parascedosporium putredinis]|uniref:STAS domain-containing protein n=1 Tax=Parascedosporium putredinis TaxID=1442378 RepID=A0A9P1H0E3_9PEZI|nr:unnamed protein product [Parascedosporium putredinis]CAI7991685.1 unnamed protein product [Parascedosporium putredinis]